MTVHLAFPIRVVNGRYVTIRQNSDDDGIVCVRNILAYELGERIEHPDFGVIDPTFQTMPINLEDIARAITYWEPRVDAEIGTIEFPDGHEELEIQIKMAGGES